MGGLEPLILGTVPHLDTEPGEGILAPSCLTGQITLPSLHKKPKTNALMQKYIYVYIIILYYIILYYIILYYIILYYIILDYIYIYIGVYIYIYIYISVCIYIYIYHALILICMHARRFEPISLQASFATCPNWGPRPTGTPPSVPPRRAHLLHVDGEGTTDCWTLWILGVGESSLGPPVESTHFFP